ncbi:MAG: hypothetical protein PUF51_05825 [Bifidobacteriaceae bacterium]|nr:hypothetical protein [Bifidobacteriaceae bacterium]
MPTLSAMSPWFIVLILITVIIAVFARRGVALIVLALCMIAQTAAIMPYLGHADTELSAGTREIMADMATADSKDPQLQGGITASKRASTTDQCARIMTLNVKGGLADPTQIIDTVADRRVEVLALQDANDSFITQLQEDGLNDYLPNLIKSDPDASGNVNVIFTMDTLGDPSSKSISSSFQQYPTATISFKGDTIRFIDVNTVKANTSSDLWGASLNEITDWAQRYAMGDTAYILLGDFNATTSQQHMQRILDAGFRDAARVTRTGMQFTWPSDETLVPSMAAIDHILVNQGVHVGDATTMKIAGTDHKAVLATIEPSTQTDDNKS